MNELIELSEDFSNVFPVWFEDGDTLQVSEELFKIIGQVARVAGRALQSFRGQEGFWITRNGRRIFIFAQKGVDAGQEKTLATGGLSRLALFKGQGRGASPGKGVVQVEGLGKAFFKSGQYSDEVAPYKISRALGEDFVPPVTTRKIGSLEGTLQTLIPGRPLFRVKAVDRFSKKVLPDNDVAKGAAFDYLVGNRDRHAGNVIISTTGKMHLIDHSDSFGSSSVSLFYSLSRARNLNTSSVKGWKGKWPSIEKVLKESGKDSDDIIMMRARYDNLMQASDRGESFLSFLDRSFDTTARNTASF
jgi:hypothetical protein